MNRKLTLFAAILIALVTGTQPAMAGGWSVATLDHLPETIIAGEPITVGFVFRQHGNDERILSDLTPIITATLTNHNLSLVQEIASWISGTSTAPLNAEDDTALSIALAEDSPGHYSAEIVFPLPGEWQWSISAFGPDQALPPLTVLRSRPATGTATAPLTGEELIARGQALFVAKGCVVCHEHSEAGAASFASINVGPVLTTYSSEAAFLRSWLSDPGAVTANSPMPALRLDDAEIDALIAFLNADTRLASDN